MFIQSVRPSIYEARTGPGAVGSPLRSLSLSSAAGGRETRTSAGAGLFSSLNGGGDVDGFGTNSGFSDSEFSILSNNEKSTMQNLNDRLAAYLEKVKSLEVANQELELKIREFLKTRAPVIDKDLSGYYANINLLQSQIQMGTMENRRLMVQIDNERLAIEDFKTKYATWMMLRKGVEQDISGLGRARDELTLANSDLEIEIEGLNQELMELKKNHEGADLQNHMGGEVNVEMNCGPHLDLLKVLADMREQYEAITAKKRSDLEKWYQVQSSNLKQEAAVHTEVTQTSKNEVTQLKCLLQSLEIELQSALSMKNSTEHMVAETEARYGAELQKLQVAITRLEEELSGVRSDMERHSYEYQMLLGVKMRLEQEIATYCRLLEDEDFSSSFIEQTERAIGSTVSSTVNNSLKNTTIEGSGTSGGSTTSRSTKRGTTTSVNSMSSGEVTDTVKHSGTLYGNSKSDNTMHGSTTSGNTLNGSTESGSSRSAISLGSSTVGSGEVAGSIMQGSTVYGNSKSDNTMHSSITSGNSINGSIENGSRMNAISLEGNTLINKAKSDDTGSGSSASSVNRSTLNVIVESGGTGSSTPSSSSTISSSAVIGSTESTSSVIGSIVSGSTMNGGISNGTTVGGSTKNESTMNGDTVSTVTVSGSSKFGSALNSSAVSDSIENGSMKSGSIEYESDSNESDGFELGSPINSPVSGIPRRSIKIRRVRKVIQDLVDGKVVSTSIEEKEEPME